MRLYLLLAAAATMIAGSPAIAAGRSGEAELARVVGSRVAGKPVDCLDTTDQVSAQVIDGTAIVYGVGARLWVNRPEGGADRLSSDDVLVTHLHGSQLCRLDPITLLDRTSRIPHGFVTLGSFVPYSRPQPAKG